MANLIGKLRGKTGEREVSASRLAEDEIEVHAASWNTFVTVIVDRLGRVQIKIARQIGDRAKEKPTTLTEITLNSESDESPLFGCDGLLREQLYVEGVDEYICEQHGLNLPRCSYCDTRVPRDHFNDTGICKIRLQREAMKLPSQSIVEAARDLDSDLREDR